MSDAPQILDMDERDYHSDHTRISHSMLEKFRESPALFEGHFITHEYAEEKTAALDFGKAAHALALESRKVYVPIPPEVLNLQGHRKGERWKAFEAEHEGKILFKPEEIEVLEKMIARLRKHPLAKDIVEAPARREVVVHWTDRATGVDCKCRIDVLRDGFEWIADMKTARSVDRYQWTKQAYDAGYHRQADFYRRAVEAICQSKPMFFFVPMLKEPPYTVKVIELDEIALLAGERENDRLLAEFAERAGKGDWNDRGHGIIEQWSLPPWAERREFSGQ